MLPVLLILFSLELTFFLILFSLSCNLIEISLLLAAYLVLLLLICNPLLLLLCSELRFSKRSSRLHLALSLTHLADALVEFIQFHFALLAGRFGPLGESAAVIHLLLVLCPVSSAHKIGETRQRVTEPCDITIGVASLFCIGILCLECFHSLIIIGENIIR